MKALFVAAAGCFLMSFSHAAQSPVDPFLGPKLAPTTAAANSTNGARFGCSRNTGTKFHGGTDLKAAVGTEFKAIYSGVVELPTRTNVSNTNFTDNVGNYVIVKSSDPKISIKYCHLQEVSVKKGDTITQGQVLGKTGQSGNAYGVPNPHLHVEVSTDHFATNTKYVDPEPFLKTQYGSNTNTLDCLNPATIPQ